MAEDKTPKGDINFESNQSVKGLNMDSIPSQVEKGSLSYALNAALENFDANSITYQNEPGNEFCLNFPHNYVLIGKYLIPEQSKQIFFLANPATGDSEIGYMLNNDCVYHTLINAKCLNFDVNYPIHKAVHKTNNCGTELYWAQPNADSRRYINLDPTQIPKIPADGSTPCSKDLTDQLDCNQIRVQPMYSIPELTVTAVINGGNLTAGTYQFAFQYSDALGNPLSSYHSVTNPTPIADITITTPNFDYKVGKSIVLDIDNIETGGQYSFFNIAVIKTVNGISSVELIGTYDIEGTHKQITYAGQNVTQIRLTINDIFEQFPFYGPADDVTTAQDVLIWKGLSAPQRINYQKIASQITLQWETYRIPPGENYSNELNATNLRGYLRDEIYPFEFVPILASGKVEDSFHIPGRKLTQAEILMPDVPPSDDDFIEDIKLYPNGAPYWRIYNTAVVLGFSPGFSPTVGYKGPYNYGAFAYWESDQKYPCDRVMWGDLADTPIRHHKFPDVAISPIIESKVFNTKDTMEMGNDAVFPIGVKVDIDQIRGLIAASDLTPEQKADIVGFKIVRGDRTDNKSIVAKGMLRNVGKYTRDGEDFYFPNYPYNDLQKDPFINVYNNSYTEPCKPYNITIVNFNAPIDNPVKTYTEVSFTSCNSAGRETQRYNTLGTFILNSLSKPELVGPGDVNKFVNVIFNEPIKEIYTPAPDSIITISESNYDIYHVYGRVNCSNPSIPGFPATYFTLTWEDAYLGHTVRNLAGDANFHLHAVINSSPPVVTVPTPPFQPCNFPVDKVGTVTVADQPLEIISNPEFAYRQIFNSPETSFGQPFLGDVLKLESVMFGKGLAHFVEVKDNAKYRLITLEAQQDAAKEAAKIAGSDISAFFTAYQAFLEITINSVARVNFAYSFNSIADYNYTRPVPNGQHIKQRRLDLKRYLIPAVQNVGEPININNFERETSVYLRTEGSDDGDPTPLPFPHLSPNMLVGGNPILLDSSRYTAGTNIGGRSVCDVPSKEEPIQVVSYYASIKNTFRGMWGQIYSYQTIDTGYQVDLSLPDQPTTVFGGDTFICRFAYKTKLPFFIDNTVGKPDDADVFYDQLGNVAFPRYWHSSRSITQNSENFTHFGVLPNFYSYKAHNFDCPNSQLPPPPAINPDRLFYDGIFYLFAYGIPNFYVESSYNVDLRQAFNNKEGDFWPHVSNRIPDDWVQESFVSIENDNTYYYNTTYSKQNKETFYSHIPANFQNKPCEFIYPFRAIFSDPQVATVNTTVNNWLVYRASSYFDFPQNYGKLTSLDGIDHRQVLARFENKSLLYNALYTNQTNTQGQIYLGQALFSPTSPPLDYGETDLGYVGSQNKFLLKIPQGQISVDAKRGQLFLLAGSQIKDLSAPGSGMNRFFTDHLAFEILRYFPGVNIDNAFNAVGLCGVYDGKFDRVIITKLDYIPLDKNIKFDSDLQEFYKETIVGDTTFRTTVFLSDRTSFCNKSWTLSYNLVTDCWISFHSYLPNWYIGENNFFYSGKKGCCTDFDFAFLVGELVPNPPTSTTTSSSTSSTTSTTSTTTTLSCSLFGGTVQVFACDLVGTAVIIIPPVCKRPSNVGPIALYTGYNIISPPSTVVSTGSVTASCDAKTFVGNNTTNVTLTLLTAQVNSLAPGSSVYANNGTNDCSTIPNGFYFTLDPNDSIYGITGGIITSVTPCTLFTTTTTTTLCEMYLYTVDIFNCGTCVSLVSGQIGNSEPLTLGKWYFDSNSEQKFFIKTYDGCTPGFDRSISNADKHDVCPQVACTTTTSTTINTGPYFKYNVNVSNCASCATLLAINEVINLQELIVGKWYYDTVTMLRIQIIGIIGTVAELPDVNIDPATQQNTCAAVICP